MSSLNLAVRSLRRRRTRTVLTVSGIVVGVAMIMVLLSVSAGASTQTGGLLRNALGAQITVVNGTTPSFPGGGRSNFTGGPPPTGGAGGSGGFGAFFGAGNTLPESEVKSIEGISGVYAVSPQLSTSGYIDGDAVLLYGIEPSTFADATNGLTMANGSMFTSSGNDSIVVSSTFATNLGLSVGSNVTVGAKSTGGAIYKVVGVYTPTSTFGPGSRSAYLLLSSAQAISNQANKVTEIYVKTNNPSLVDSVASTITSTITGVRTLTASSLPAASTLSTTLSTLFIVIGIVALLAGAFGVINTMMMSISERTREVGTLRAIGAEKSDILKIFMSEAFMIGVIGALAGVLIGAVISFGLPSLTGSSAANSASGFFGGGLLSSLQTSITANNVVLSLGLGVLVGTLAGIYPAWRASRMDPVEALRHV